MSLLREDGSIGLTLLSNYIDPLFPLNYIYDLSNYIIILIIILLSVRKNFIDIYLAIGLGLSSLSVFFLNGVLFEWQYMPDQSQYLNTVRSLRNFEINMDDCQGEFIRCLYNRLDLYYYNPFHSNTSTYISEFLYALYPMPYVETFKSIGFMNKSIYCIILIYLNHKKLISKQLIWFLVIYPSAVLYTGLSLEEPLIVAFMIFGFTFLVRENYLALVFMIFILLATKSFMGLFLLLTSFFYIYFFKLNYKFLFSAIFLFAGTFLWIKFGQDFIEYVNFRRQGFFLENFENTRTGSSNIWLKDFTYTQSKQEALGLNIDELGRFNFMFLFLEGIIKFLFSPYLWNVKNYFQTFQSMENILLLFVLLHFFILTFKIDKKRAIFWSLSLLLIYGCIGFIIFNDGAIARYRFMINISYLYVLLLDTRFSSPKYKNIS